MKLTVVTKDGNLWGDKIIAEGWRKEGEKLNLEFVGFFKLKLRPYVCNS